MDHVGVEVKTEAVDEGAAVHEAIVVEDNEEERDFALPTKGGIDFRFSLLNTISICQQILYYVS